VAIVATVQPLRAQDKVIASVIASDNCPAEADTITANVLFALRGSNELLGSFTGSLQWDPAILEYVASSGVLGGFIGNVNPADIANGTLAFNGINPSGAGDSLAILMVTFKVLAVPDSASTLLDLDYSAIAAARTLRNLLPTTTINDAIACIATGIHGRRAVPNGFALYRNYPNPFNPATRIRYELFLKGRVVLKIMNLLGQEVRTLVDAEQPPGFREVVWDGRNNRGQRAPSGVYLYELKVRDFAMIRKMVLNR
jgi:hypothetical protein